MYMGISQSRIYSRLYLCISRTKIQKNKNANNISIPHIESAYILHDEEVIVSIINSVKLEAIIEVDEMEQPFITL
jgi:hypothetical protein